VNVAALPTGSELAAAEQLHAWHAALVAAGFSRDEALQLLIALIVAE
jgi:hypothetical protein